MKRVPEWNRETLLQSRLFEPLHPVIARLANSGFPALQDCNALLEAQPVVVHNGALLRFVQQQSGKLPFEERYEPRCYLRGEVQTREHNWHDLLNALVWLTFPGAKAAINARHYQALTGEQDVVSSQRGAVRDMNTLFDESGVIVVCAAPELAMLLRDFRWQELFWQRRAQVQAKMAFHLFGHGLYEKALQPYIGLTGQGLVLVVEQAYFSWPQAQRLAYLDGMLADYLNAPLHCRSTRELTPVPLLGVPGWSAENACAEYYGNTDYFRPGRLRAAC
ncbi:MAG: DUF3025 domain-containing protein [Nitrosomonadales bacterium]|nr:DUF3025 domain-containing protein [Nitrosomonadales bacterium]